MILVSSDENPTNSFINKSSEEHTNQELSLEKLQAINGAGWVKDALEFIGDRADQTVAFYAGWAGAVSGGADVAKGAYDAGVNAGIIKEEK
jgi:hypothetical protein